ncbi:MAG: hypothetical protein A2X49_07600 [Lentisphaerae bacterium GWF2_52_8]|nr:MAG: hypothetical protein A2X49_07600 [Lentisphaerae bacterium GWF2_52_8]
MYTQKPEFEQERPSANLQEWQEAALARASESPKISDTLTDTVLMPSPLPPRDDEPSMHMRLNVSCTGLTRKPPEKYRFRKSIGHGGMKTVLQVRDRDTSRDVAMAVMPDYEDRPKSDYARFIQEARITANLEHPNIVPVHDIGVDTSGAPYFTMKMLKGESLASILKKLNAGDAEYIKKYDLHRLLRMFLKVCNGVAFAHSRNVIHLDLKPENIQIGDYGEVLILDWGLARVLGESIEDEEDNPASTSLPPPGEKDGNTSLQITMDGITKGTPGYMAPEQAAGRNSHKDTRTDIYSLGAILYSILTKLDPIEGKDVKQILHDTMHGNIVPPRLRRPDLMMPSPIEAVVLKAMMLDPDSRYQHVWQIRDDIYAFMGGFATSAERASFFKRTVLLVKRHRLLFSSITVITLLLLSFGGYALYNLSKESGDWIKAYEQDFSTPYPDTESLVFMDRLNKKTMAPWTCDKGGLKMEKYDWLWLKNVKVPGNVRLVVKMTCPSNPDALEVVINSRIEPLREWWFVPTGYSFQFAGYGGSKDIVCRNEDALGPDVMNATESHFRANQIHTVVFERVDENLSMSVDGLQILRVTDLFPPLGPGLNRIGMRSFSTSMRILSIAVYSLALPEKASPMIAGDALLEANHSEEAVAKYLTIADNYDKLPIGERALAKAYITAATKPSKDRLKTLLEIKKQIEVRYPKFAYREQVMEVDALVYWRQRQFKEVFDLVRQLFEISPDTNVVTRLLETQHQELPPDFGYELLSWIRKSRNMKRLNLAELGLESLRPLDGMPLIFLDCSKNRLASLDGLRGMPLESFSCPDNQIEVLDPLWKMPLKDLDISNNKVRDIAPLAGMSLKQLNCRRNLIQSIEPLRGMPLESLNIESCKVDSLDPLKGMKLEMLNCKNTGVSSLEPLRGIALTTLNCSGTKIDSLEPLRGMPLRVLDLSNCKKLNDITPLAEIKTLERLNIPPHIQDIEFLREMPKLEYLSTIDQDASPGGQQETASEFWRKYDEKKK